MLDGLRDRIGAYRAGQSFLARSRDPEVVGAGAGGATVPAGASNGDPTVVVDLREGYST